MPFPSLACARSRRIFALVLLLAAAPLQAETTTPASPVAAPEGSSEFAELLPLVAQRLGGKAEDYRLRRMPDVPLLEVYARNNNRVAYVDPTVKYAFIGTLYDAEKHTNLTAQREHELNRFAPGEIPQARAIQVVKGKGTLHFAVFEDPDCPFCRQMEAQLDKLPDYTLDVLLLPLGELHPKAEAAAAAIWCAEDPSGAWSAYMHTQQLPAARDCDTPIQELQILARKHRINGTPTLVMPDGEIVEGMPDLQSLQDRIAAAQTH